MTLVDSGGSLSSLGLLLIILFFMFAIIGRSLFAFAPIRGAPNMELNEHANFGDFWTSFLLLFRCATGEAWHLIMFDIARTYSTRGMVSCDAFYSFHNLNLPYNERHKRNILPCILMPVSMRVQSFSLLAKLSKDLL